MKILINTKITFFILLFCTNLYCPPKRKSNPEFLKKLEENKKKIEQRKLEKAQKSQEIKKKLAIRLAANKLAAVKKAEAAKTQVGAPNLAQQQKPICSFNHACNEHNCICCCMVCGGKTGLSVNSEK